MVSLLLALSLPAEAADVRHLVWQLSVGGQVVGERKVDVKYLPAEVGSRRMIEAYTTVDAKALGGSLSWKQRLVAVSVAEPASFQAVMQEDGQPSEVQGRWSTAGWTVTKVDAGRSRTSTYGVGEVDLSTADLFDPGSSVAIYRYESPRILLAETGEVVAGAVERLGPSEITIDGQKVPVDGYAWKGEIMPIRLYYTSDGWLVRYETTMLGYELAGQLVDPPPLGLDDTPIGVEGGGVQEIEL